MIRLRWFAAALLCAVFSLGGIYQVKAEEKAQSLEIIVPFGPGGGADQLARMAAPRLEEILNRPVTVTNIPGATGVTGIETLLERPADGNTLAVLTADTFSLLALTPPPWELADIEPLAIMIRQPSGLFVAADSRFQNWDDFEKEASARPYKLKVAVTGDSSPDDITTHYLTSKGIRLDTAIYDYPENRYQAVLMGKAQALYEQAGDIRAFLKDKRMRPMLFLSTRLHPISRACPLRWSRAMTLPSSSFAPWWLRAEPIPRRSSS